MVDPYVNEYEALMSMQAADPEGKAGEPTEAECDAFAAWATETYGTELFVRYMTDAWMGEFK